MISTSPEKEWLEKIAPAVSCALKVGGVKPGQSEKYQDLKICQQDAQDILIIFRKQ